MTIANGLRPDMFKNRLKRHIHFSDCDPAQIVFYPRYFVWFDQATESLFRAVDFCWEEKLGKEEGEFAGVPLLGASADFRSACKMGDDIEIETWIDDWQDRKFTVKHAIHNNGTLAVLGEELRVWVVRAADRPAGIRAGPIPAQVKALFSDN